MKRVGFVLCCLAALQFASGEARLCCNWTVFVQAAAVTTVQEGEWTASCPNCPQAPARGIPVGGCACPTVTGTEPRPVDSTIHISQERFIKTSDAQAPPVVAMVSACDGSLHVAIAQAIATHSHTPFYILNSALLI